MAAPLSPASIDRRISLTTRLISAFFDRFSPRRFSLCLNRFAADAMFGISITLFDYAQSLVGSSPEWTDG